MEISNISLINSSFAAQAADNSREVPEGMSGRPADSKAKLQEFCSSMEKLLTSGKADDVLKAFDDTAIKAALAYFDSASPDNDVMEKFYLAWADAYIAKGTYLSIKNRILVNQNALAVLAELEARLNKLGGVEAGSKTYFELGSRYARALVGSGNPDGAIKMLQGSKFFSRLKEASAGDQRLKPLYLNSVLTLVYANSTGGEYAGEYKEAKTKALDSAEKVLSEALARTDLTPDERYKLLKPYGDLYYERRFMTESAGIYRDAIKQLGATPAGKLKGFKAYLELARCRAGRARPAMAKGATQSDFTESEKAYDELLGVIFERQAELRKAIAEKPDKQAEAELNNMNALYELVTKEKAAQHQLNYLNFWAATDGFNEVVSAVEKYAKAGVSKDILSGFEFRSHYVLTYCYRYTGRESMQEKELQRIWDTMTAWWWPTKEEFMSRQALKYAVSLDAAGSSNSVTDKAGMSGMTVIDKEKIGSGSRTITIFNEHKKTEKTVFENFTDRTRVGNLSFYLVEQANMTVEEGESRTHTMKTAWGPEGNTVTGPSTTIKNTVKGSVLQRIAPGMEERTDDSHVVARVDVFYDMSGSESYETSRTMSGGKISDKQDYTGTEDKRYKYTGFGVKFNHKTDRSSAELSASYDEVKKIIQAKIQEEIKCDEKGHFCLRAGLGATYDNNELAADKETPNPDKGFTGLVPEIGVKSRIDKFTLNAGAGAVVDIKHSSADKGVKAYTSNLTLTYDLGEMMGWDVSPSAGATFVFNRDGVTSDTGTVSAGLTLSKYQTSLKIGVNSDLKLENGTGAGASLDAKVPFMKDTRVLAGGGHSVNGDTYLSALLRQERSDIDLLGVHLNAAEVFGGFAYTLDNLAPAAGIAIDQELSHRSPLDTQKLIINAQYLPLTGPLFRVAYEKRTENGELGLSLNSRTIVDADAFRYIGRNVGLGLGVQVRKGDERSTKSLSVTPTGIEFKESPRIYDVNIKETNVKIGPSLTEMGIPVPFAVYRNPNPGTGQYLKDGSHFGRSNDKEHIVSQAVTMLYSPGEEQLFVGLEKELGRLRDEQGIEMFVDKEVKVPEKNQDKAGRLISGIRALIGEVYSNGEGIISSVRITRPDGCEVKDRQLVIGVRQLKEKTLGVMVGEALARAREGSFEAVMPDFKGKRISLKGVEDEAALAPGLQVLGDLIESNAFRLENLREIVIIAGKAQAGKERAEKGREALFIEGALVMSLVDPEKRTDAIKQITGKLDGFDLRNGAGEIEEKARKAFGSSHALELHRDQDGKYRVTVTDFKKGKDEIRYKDECFIVLSFNPADSSVVLKRSSRDSLNGKAISVRVNNTENGFVIDSIPSDLSYALGFVETDRGKLSEAEDVAYSGIIRDYLEQTNR